MIVTSCNLCGSSEFTQIIDLGFHPCADTFVDQSYANEMEPHYPLRLCLCQSCGHVFTGYVVPPEERYQKYDYSYDSSNSPLSIEHFSNLAGLVCTKLSLGKDDFVIDVGSNIGTLLEQIRKKSGARIMGVDPAANIAKLAEKNGIPTINSFFNRAAVDQILEHGHPTVITGTNVLNHTADINGFIDNVFHSLAEDGHLIIDVPYLLDLVKKVAFDTIYLEHVNYFGARALTKFLNRKGLAISHIERSEYMLGTLRLFVRRGSDNAPMVNQFIADEMTEKLYDPETYVSFMNRLRNFKEKLNSQLYKIKREGGRIIGIGAATKGNTLLNYCRIDSDLLDYITDSSPLKIGKITPGSHIQIRGDEEITPDITHAVILPWNIAEYLVEKLKHHKFEILAPQMDETFLNES